MEKDFAFQLKFDQEPEWENLLRTCIDCEFSTKAEQVLERIGKSWHEIPFRMPQDQLLYGVKAMLHSVIAKDGFEQEWLNRVNEALKIFGIENLDVLNLNPTGFNLVFKHSQGDLSFKEIVKRWINPVLGERDNKLRLLSPRFENALSRIGESFEDLKRLRDYVSSFKERIHWQEYRKLRSKAKELVSIIKLLNERMENTVEGTKQVLSIERRELQRIIGGKTLKFQLRE